MAAFAGTTTLSVLAHTVALGFVFLCWAPEEPLPPAATPERILTFRLPVAPRKPSPPARSPAPNIEQPKVEWKEDLPDALKSKAAPGDVHGAEALPPDPGQAGKDEPRALQLPGLVDVPLPLGVGAKPQPGAPRTPWQGGFEGRGAGKAQALRRFGGGAGTESAVERGLGWLAAHQDDGGGWSTDSFHRHCGGSVPCSGRGLPEFHVGVTSLAALAFLGAGHVPAGSPPANPSGAGTAASYRWEPQSPHASAVARALEHLLSQQDSRGAFGSVGDNYMYNHSLATLAMAEACAMTGLARYRQSTEAAISFSLMAQQAQGGWDYTQSPTQRNDLSITGWQIMAFRSARDAGILIEEDAFDKMRRFLTSAVTPTGEGIYANLGQEAGRRGINMVAVGLLGKLYLGAQPSESAVRNAAGRLLRAPPDPKLMADWEATFHSYYYWYTATLALFHLGGEEWKAWNVFLLRSLLPLQSRKGHEEGSWPPEPNWIGVSGGRVYATAINVLTLETYYRHEPLFGSKKS